MKTEKKDTKYSDKIFTKDSFEFSSEVEDGIIYVDENGNHLDYAEYTFAAMAKEVFSGLPNATDTKEYLFKKLFDKIKADNGSINPTNGKFTMKSKKFTVPVEKIPALITSS